MPIKQIITFEVETADDFEIEVINVAGHDYAVIHTAVSEGAVITFTRSPKVVVTLPPAPIPPPPPPIWYYTIIKAVNRRRAPATTGTLVNPGHAVSAKVRVVPDELIASTSYLWAQEADVLTGEPLGIYFAVSDKLEPPQVVFALPVPLI